MRIGKETVSKVFERSSATRTILDMTICLLALSLLVMNQVESSGGAVLLPEAEL